MWGTLDFNSAAHHAEGMIPVLKLKGPTRIMRKPSAYDRVLQKHRNSAYQAALRWLPAEQAGLALSMAVGSSQHIDPRDNSNFKNSGLAHLSAVSGANIAIVLGAVWWILGWFIRCRVYKAMLAMIVLLIFVGIVGPEASVIRAAIMAVIGMVALLCNRRSHSLSALSVTLVLVCVLWPYTSVQIGFWLSAAATAGLVIGSRPMAMWLKQRGLSPALSGLFSVSACAYLATAPVLIAVGLSAPLHSIIANLAVAVVVPWVTIAATSAVAVSPYFPVLAELLMASCYPSLWWLRYIAEIFGGT